LSRLFPRLAGKYLSICHLNERCVVDPSFFCSSRRKFRDFLVIFFNSASSKVAVYASTRRALVDCRLPLARQVIPDCCPVQLNSRNAATSRGTWRANFTRSTDRSDSRSCRFCPFDHRFARLASDSSMLRVRRALLGRFVRISSAFAGRSHANASVRVSLRNRRVRPCDAMNLDRRCRAGALTLCVRREVACKRGCTCRPRKVRRFY